MGIQKPKENQGEKNPFLNSKFIKKCDNMTSKVEEMDVWEGLKFFPGLGTYVACAAAGAVYAPYKGLKNIASWSNWAKKKKLRKWIGEKNAENAKKCVKLLMRNPKIAKHDYPKDNEEDPTIQYQQKVNEYAKEQKVPYLT